ncbi:sigma-54-dependent Fis family transcriptional regulator [Clostridium senegalense]|uniref:sigma-54-dependent Fis family transcriptional regulator n=1 Tax=Clostridium senegalense TaxID=1465809 RepID=UPI00028842C0|nr:sigma-54-dependent Fis family transcriptional regulator [Clostridium senegalense]
MNLEELIYKAEDIMNKNFVKVFSHDTVKYATEAMIKNNLDEVIIINELDRLEGIFTRNDLAKVENVNSKYPEVNIFEDSIINHGTRNVFTVSPQEFARDVRDMMIKKNIGRVPVVKQGKVIGVLTSNNLRDSFYIKIDEMFSLQNNILNNIHEAICICDVDGKVIYWNKSAEKLYKLKACDIVGENVKKHFNNPIIPKVLKEGKPLENIYHEPMTGKSVILSVIPIFNQKNDMIAVVSTDRDITEVVYLSEKLENANAQVEALSKAYSKEFSNNYTFLNIIGKSKKIIEAISLAQKVAPTSASVLITGESGTGKEVFARSIHEASGRNGQFVAVNCSAIPENLLESELFGYVEGAFTGATKKGKMGMFEFANNGTLFLDEIGDMPIGMQSKLLRVLQDGVVNRLGSEKFINTNTRIIAATNKDLDKAIKEKSFRCDLFYRLAIVQIELPPLRERRGDIKNFIDLFIKKISQKEKIDIISVDEEIYEILSSYKWEGNIRELKNVVQRMVVLSTDKKISAKNIPNYILEYNKSQIMGLNNMIIDKYDLEKRVKQLESNLIKEVMNICNGNKVKAAEMLKIKRSTLYYKLNQID